MSADRAVPDDLPRLGSMVGRYRLDALLGRGGMGVVFRATDLELQRSVAVKFLSPEFSTDAAFRERFVRESRLAAAIEHPAIVPVYEAGTMGDALFIAMRFVPGQDLGRLLRAEGPLEPGRTVALLSPVADALDAAHRRGLVHRDVKPANILVERDDTERASLTDFGLSRRLGDRTLASRNGALGTIDYAAPEQILGLPVDGRADQYALACVVVHCLTGSAPFEADSDAAVLYAQLHAAPPSVHARRPDLPPDVDAVMARALGKEPRSRYAHCREFVDALAQVGGPAMAQAPLRSERAEGRAAELPEPGAAVAGPREADVRPATGDTAAVAGAATGIPRGSAASRPSARRGLAVLVAVAAVALLSIVTLAGIAAVLSSRQDGGAGAGATSEPGMETRGTLGPGAGEVIVFAAERDGDYDLYALRAGDPGPRLLRDTPRDEHQPAISPDGTTIAYVVGTGTTRDIWLMDIAGGSPRRLTSHPADDTDPAWSADGTRLAFASQRSDPLYDIWEIQDHGAGLDEADARNLTDRAALEHQPGWTSAGDGILIASNYYGGNRDLVRIDAGDRREVKRLTDGPAFDFQPDVSPDGASVALYRREYCPSCLNDRGQADLFVIDADGTHPRRLTQSAGRDEIDPEWAPDGRALVYTAMSDAGSSLMVVSADGRRVRSLVGDTMNAVEPSWGVAAGALATSGPGASPAASGG